MTHKKIILLKGVDLIIGPSTLTDKDKKKISEIIADYKKTGKLPPKSKKPTHRKSKKAKRNKRIAASLT